MNVLCNKNSDEWLFGSAQQSWKRASPYLSLCLQYTVLNWIPLGFLWLSSLIYIPLLRRRCSIDYGCRGVGNIFKSVLITLLLYKEILSFCFAISESISNRYPPRVMYIQPVLSSVSLVLLIYVNRLTFMKGVHSSEIVFLYWSIQLITTVISMVLTFIMMETWKPHIFTLFAITVEFLLVLISFIANCFADNTVLHYKRLRSDKISPETISSRDFDENVKTCPELEASFLSILTFSWFNRMLYNGYRQSVTIRDLFYLKNEDKCETIVPIFMGKWRKQISQRQTKRPCKKKAFSGTYHSLHRKPSDGQRDVFSTFNKKHCNGDVPVPSLIWTLFTIVGFKYVLYGVVRVGVDQLIFIQPILLGALIAFIQDSGDFPWHGYVIIIAMFVVSTLRTVLYQQYNHISNVLGMRLRTGVISAIYRKALKLSSSSRKSSTLGEIVNLMSVDCQKLPSVTFDFHSLISIPLTLVVGFYSLWRQLGISTLSGILLIFGLMPINAIIGIKIKTLQARQMELKDTRIKWMSEMLSGMKVFKLYAWEKSFEDRIQNIRNEECRILRLSTYMNSLSAVSCFCAPYLIALSSFVTFILISPSNILDVNKTFVSLSIVNILNTPMSYLPSAIVFVIQSYVSMERINKFLIEEELAPDNVNIDNVDEKSIEIVNGSFSWGNDDDAILTNINIKIYYGELVAVVGEVGGGKSSLISAILGEMNKISGTVTRKADISYVPQQAWCQNATIQDNILFGKSFLSKEYKRVIEVCALNPDLDILSDGDQTEVGEKGINLSGGQKQRISIARAVYQDASVYLLDDPLSAVDAHVNTHIFDKVIGKKGILSEKTRILVTHNISHLPNVDRIYLMKGGRILEQGTYDALLKDSSGEFADYIRFFRENEKRKMEANANIVEETNISSRQESILKSAEHEEIQKRTHLRGMSSNKILSLEVTSMNNKDQPKCQLIKDELIETEAVRLSVFLSYIRPATFPMVLLVLGSYLGYLSCSIAGNIFLSSWSETNSFNGSQNQASNYVFFQIYGGLGIAQTIIILIQNLCLAQGTFMASKSLHANLLRTLLRVPNSFFEITPIGRILNRIGRDIDVVDISIPTSIAFWLITAAGVIGTVFVISYATPYFLIAMIPLSILYHVIQKFYICTNRQLKRIDAITRSPIYSHFHETITGVSTIRAFNRSEEFIEKCDSMIDLNQMAWYPNIVSFRWLQLNLEIIGNIIILCSGLFAVLTRASIGAGLAGLSVSYALQITISLNNMVRNTCDLESHVVSVERIGEYTAVKEEAPWIIDKLRQSPNWPSEGKVEFCNYSVKYRPELECVLNNFNLVVNAGEKLGIVGRTGAGKSSLAMALLRIIEPISGFILIDDVNIQQIGLHDLRNKITIIPQDPVVFSGTLRMNLDPFDKYSDDAIWTALELAHLKSFVINIPNALHFIVDANGENLSVGQKQLLCLARALLKKTKIIVMDEATAAIDWETDSLIQRSIRRHFKHCTILTIAHRLNTIMDYDRIIVLEDGRIKELGCPQTLLTDKYSLFSQLAKDAGLI